VPPCLRPGFTLTEILIVVALIVLLLALAMPAFNFITGGRSEDAALNQISAMLARARTEAEGVQEPRGILFYFDKVSQRDMMCIVKVTPPNASSDRQDASTDPNTRINYSYLDLAAADHLPLPRGISVHVITDQSGPARYLGYNPFSNTTIPIGGVVMFDAYGRLATPKYGFRMKVNGTTTPTDMGNLLDPTGSTPDFVQSIPTNGNNQPRAALGLAVFDKDTADSANGEDIDPYDQTPPGSNESRNENWIDINATIVTINRYNGTLIKSQ
jgi:prepilin-type N-terminal cleavage/methylation domain-containing protein